MQLIGTIFFITRLPDTLITCSLIPQHSRHFLAPGVFFGGDLKGPPDLQQGGLGEIRPQQLDAERQLIGAEPAHHRHARHASVVGGDGELVGVLHQHGIAVDVAKAKSRGRRGRGQQGIHLVLSAGIEGGLKITPDQRTHPQRPPVILGAVLRGADVHPH